MTTKQSGVDIRRHIQTLTAYDHYACLLGHRSRTMKFAETLASYIPALIVEVYTYQPHHPSAIVNSRIPTLLAHRIHYYAFLSRTFNSHPAQLDPIGTSYAQQLDSM